MALLVNLSPFDSRTDGCLYGRLNSLFSDVECRCLGHRAKEYLTAVHYFVAMKIGLPCH